MGNFIAKSIFGVALADLYAFIRFALFKHPLYLFGGIIWVGGSSTMFLPTYWAWKEHKELVEKGFYDPNSPNFYSKDLLDVEAVEEYEVM